jgi:hypothetical protein
MNYKRIKVIGMIFIIIAATFTAWSSTGDAIRCRGQQGPRGNVEGDQGIGGQQGHGC